MIKKIKSLYTKLINSSFIRSSGIYTISGFINAGIPLLLLPILTRELSPSDYGIVAMFQLCVSIVYPLIGMNLDGAIGRKYYEKDNSDFSAFIGTCIILFFSGFIVLSLLFWLNIDFIQNITQIPETWLKFVIIVAFCQFITSVLLTIYQVKVEPIKYGLIRISQSFINIGLTILFVIFLNKTWDGRIEAQIIAGLVTALLSYIILYKKGLIKFKINRKDIVYALTFGIPLIPHALGGFIFTSIDRFFLLNLIGLEETGNYTVAYQLGSVVGLITMSVNNAFVPWLFENLKKESLLIKKKIVKWTYIYFIILLIGAGLLLLILPFIINILVGKSFSSTNTYTSFIVFGFVFQGMYYMVTNYIQYAKKTYIQALVTASVALLKLPITYFSIIWFGSIGASISYCITFFLFFLLTWKLSARVYNMPWKLVFFDFFKNHK
jgi:O-antigen/teichoic acid export membrane protein